ncbi:MAG: 2'-deoxycytidine 5'-triphosphate deaminase [Verrucomicrobiia bacterium]
MNFRLKSQHKMNASPCKEWIPGALNDRQLKQLIDKEFIKNAGDSALDYSSFDLRLDHDVYEMVEGSVKPHGRGYERFLKTQKKYAKVTSWEPNEELVLKPKTTYVFKLKEQLATKLRGLPIHGQATAKSSVGRVDVLARLIVDGMHNYEEFDETMWEEDGAGGDISMFLEVTPITFHVRVKKGKSLSQLRLFYGKPEESEIKGKELYQAVFLHDEDFRDDKNIVDECLRVNVSNIPFKANNAAAFRAKSGKKEPVKLWVDKDSAGNSINLLDPSEYWDLVPSEDGRFPITKTNFFILRSKEKILLRRGVCVYCRAIDETIGEMRIHYAGFVHPYFGHHIKKDGSVVAIGTPLIFEVRGHDVNVVLIDNEPLARLQFYRMSEDCEETPNKEKLSAYHDQILRLSQFFDQFPILN